MLEGLELALRETCHLFEAPFPDAPSSGGQQQSGHARFHIQLAHVGLLFLIARRNGRFISASALLYSVSGCVLRADGFSASSVSFLFQLAYRQFNQRETCLLVANSVKTIAQAFNFVFQLLSWDSF